MSALRILYLVHDLNDAAVARRVGMLLDGGASLQLAGFWRGEAPPAQVQGVTAKALDRSFDAQLSARAHAVARRILGAGALAREFEPVDLILARNLEMLALADALRRRVPGAPPVVYECLDIHRLMLAGGPKGAIMRRIEKSLLAKAAGLVVSSPAFVEQYFAPRQAYTGPWLLVENRAKAGPTARGKSRPKAPPWRIGWFGMLRCRKSLALLSALAAGSGGRVEVLLAGKPARTELGDFDEVVARTPGLTYAGPYTAADLPALYGQVHFAWAIDYFEEGLNSAWLLPNRLYEGAAHGAVPIALAEVQTGRWLSERGLGVLLDDPPAQLSPLFESMTAPEAAQLTAAVADLAPETVMFDAEDCRVLVADLAGMAARG